MQISELSSRAVVWEGAGGLAPTKQSHSPQRKFSPGTADNRRSTLPHFARQNFDLPPLISCSRYRPDFIWKCYHLDIRSIQCTYLLVLRNLSDSSIRKSNDFQYAGILRRLSKMNSLVRNGGRSSLGTQMVRYSSQLPKIKIILLTRRRYNSLPYLRAKQRRILEFLILTCQGSGIGIQIIFEGVRGST